MTCPDRVRVRPVLVVIGLVAAFLLWDGEKLRGSLSDEPVGRVRIGEVMRRQIELQRLLDEIRRSDAEIKRLRIQLGMLDRTYSQPRL